MYFRLLIREGISGRYYNSGHALAFAPLAILPNDGKCPTFDAVPLLATCSWIAKAVAVAGNPYCPEFSFLTLETLHGHRETTSLSIALG